MKKALLSLILLFSLTGCFTSDCAKDVYRDYKYGDQVKVVAGFYKGQTGVIIARSWMYVRNCSTKAFIVRLNDSKEAEISQYALFVEESK
jgi:hypothetical protein